MRDITQNKTAVAILRQIWTTISKIIFIDAGILIDAAQFVCAIDVELRILWGLCGIPPSTQTAIIVIDHILQGIRWEKVDYIWSCGQVFQNSS